MASTLDTSPAAGAWPEPDPRKAVLLLFTTGSTTSPPPHAGGTSDPLLPSASPARPTAGP